MNPAEIQELMLHLRNITESLDKISEALQPKTITVDQKNAVTDRRNLPQKWTHLDDVPQDVNEVKDFEGDLLIRVGVFTWRYPEWDMQEAEPSSFFTYGPYTRV